MALRKEIEFRTPDGEIRYLGISISPLRPGQNQTSGFVYNFQDVTELKRLEREVSPRSAWRRWDDFPRRLRTKFGSR